MADKKIKLRLTFERINAATGNAEYTQANEWPEVSDVVADHIETALRKGVDKAYDEMQAAKDALRKPVMTTCA